MLHIAFLLILSFCAYFVQYMVWILDTYFLYNKNNERTIINEVMEIKEGVILWKKRNT